MTLQEGSDFRKKIKNMNYKELEELETELLLKQNNYKQKNNGALNNAYEKMKENLLIAPSADKKRNLPSDELEVYNTYYSIEGEIDILHREIQSQASFMKIKNDYPEYLEFFEYTLNDIFQKWSLLLKDDGYILIDKSKIETMFADLVLAEIERDPTLSEVCKKEIELVGYDPSSFIFYNKVSNAFHIAYRFLFSLDIKNQLSRNEIKDKIEEEKAKRRMYNYRIFIEAKKIIDNNKVTGSKRITQKQAIVMVNKKLGIYPNDNLIDEYGEKTQFLISLIKSYKSAVSRKSVI